MLTRASVLVPIIDAYRARKFYEQTLGLKLKQATTTQIVYQCGDGTRLALNLRPNARADHASVSFTIDDLGAEVDRLKGKGVSFMDYDRLGIKTEEGIARVGHHRVAWFEDSEGNLLSLVED